MSSSRGGEPSSGARVRARGAARSVSSLLLLLLAPFASLEAQGVRGDARSTARYVEIRGFVRDTIPRSQVTQLPDGTFEFEGERVFCPPGLSCVRYRAGEVEQTIAFTQDVGLTAWGLGVRGLSATAQLRLRAHAGDAFVWPRADDAFDALLAYAELDRAPFRFRAGRQSTTGGLGFASYDGVHALYQPGPSIHAEVYVGRSLARGLAEPRDEALRGIEDFLPDRNVYLIGAAAGAAPVPGLRMDLRYQREIFSDRSALVSERASFDAAGTWSAWHATASADWDFAFGRVGKAEVRVRAPAIGPGVTLEAAFRRYVPYFELWTIWGYFDPVGYYEGELVAGWALDARMGATLSASLRRYEDAEAPIILQPLKENARALQVAGWYQVAPTLALDGYYRIEHGFGGFLSAADVSANWRAVERATITAHGTFFQQIQEFRAGEGVVFGAGGSADFRVTDRATIAGGAMLYRQSFTNRAGQPDWNQKRAWLSLRLAFGSDPGMAARQ